MDRDARFENLYRRFYRRVAIYFVHVFKLSSDDANDLAQDVFVRVYRSLDDYRGDAEWPFIETVARNVAFNVIRERHALKRAAPVEAISAEGARLSSQLAIPARQNELVSAHEMTARLRAAIDKLPSTTQNVLLLWLNDLTYSEIAERLAITADAVKSRLRAARVRLREQLSVEPFEARLADGSLDNVVRFPSHYSLSTSITSELSDEEAVRQFDENLSTVIERLRQLLEQIASFRDMLGQHEGRIDTTTGPAVASVRSA